MTLNASDLYAGFAEPPAGSAPMMRWWWFGPDVTDAEIDRELEAMKAAGIGGAEVAYVYPLSDVTEPLVSPGFLAHLRHAADTARRLGLRLDVTLGSGWSFGGPWVTREHAARGLYWESREVGVRPLVIGPSGWPGDTLVAAFVADGSTQEPRRNYVPVPLEDGVAHVPAGLGPRHVLLAHSRLTGQNVKRAAVGAEGHVLDHYSADAIRAHLAALGDPILDAVPGELLGSVFCDSLEVYESDWTPDLPEEFFSRRGYDVLPVLYLLAVPGPEAQTVRADMWQTLAELYEERFIGVCREWAHGRGVPFRIQSYGTPPGTVSSYRYADLYEGEGWGFREVTQSRWATSAAHLYGLDVVSAEVWTWVHSPSFRATPLDLKGEAHQHFLGGINQFVGHGWPYSPPDAPGLGWFFYASGALDDRNPWWVAMPELTRYVTRLSWLLRQGEHVAEALLYLPNRDVAGVLGKAQGGHVDLWRATKPYLGDAVPGAIRDAGLDFDLLDDDAVSVLEPGSRRVIVLARAHDVPAETVSWLEASIAKGSVVVLADSTVDVAGAVRTEVSGLAETLASEVGADLAVVPAESEVGVLHRRVGTTEVYLVAVTGPEPWRGIVRPRAGRRFQVWDPMSAQVVREGTIGDGVALDLDPYEAALVLVRDDDDGWPSVSTGTDVSSGRGGEVDLGPWHVSYASGDSRPVTLPDRWEDHEETRHLSGTATYSTTFTLGQEAEVTLELGGVRPVDAGSAAERGMVGRSFRAEVTTPLGEVAEVRVDGRTAGVVWCPPYTLRLGTLEAGDHTLELAVSNTLANAVAVDEHTAALVARVEEQYGMRFGMQDLDKADAGVSSGLLAVPRLVAH
ncbi:MAG TPA: glycosyl hydrolase [Propionibacteriaceae bacterium]|nr:glycosyl hydrolase [Propionibacteriaceae bacterium]